VLLFRPRSRNSQRRAAFHCAASMGRFVPGQAVKYSVVVSLQEVCCLRWVEESISVLNRAKTGTHRVTLNKTRKEYYR
jgi:hypothetical protein